MANLQKCREIPEIFVFQRAFRAKTKGSCRLLKPGTCSSKCLAGVCYLKLQKTAKNGRFAVSPAPCAGEKIHCFFLLVDHEFFLFGCNCHILGE